LPFSSVIFTNSHRGGTRKYSIFAILPILSLTELLSQLSIWASSGGNVQTALQSDRRRRCHIPRALRRRAFECGGGAVQGLARSTSGPVPEHA
jgi:hypothetical protein